MADVAADSGSLENLRDIVVPDPVPWWPVAPGWYVVWAVALLGLLWFGVQWIRNYRANRYRREALAELERIQWSFLSPSARASALYELAVLLKRVALTAFPREVVAELSGEPWRRFLNEVGKTAAFTPDMLRLMESAMCVGGDDTAFSDDAVGEVFVVARSWIRKHGPLPTT